MSATKKKLRGRLSGAVVERYPDGSHVRVLTIVVLKDADFVPRLRQEVDIELVEYRP